MIERVKSFNSSLHNVSKKRLEQMRSGLLPKKRSTLKSISKKTRKRIQDYRAACFSRWGHVCFICGRVDETGKTLDCHHIFGRINGDDPENIVPLCNRFSGCKAHNHNAHDQRFYELQKQILNKKDIK